jgi:hypothetical protein
MIPDILAFKDPGGLRAFLAEREDRCVDVPCDDPGILIDLDTPEDFKEYCSPSLPATKKGLANGRWVKNACTMSSDREILSRK